MGVEKTRYDQLLALWKNPSADVGRLPTIDGSGNQRLYALTVLLLSDWIRWRPRLLQWFSSQFQHGQMGEEPLGSTYGTAYSNALVVILQKAVEREDRQVQGLALRWLAGYYSVLRWHRGFDGWVACPAGRDSGVAWPGQSMELDLILNPGAHRPGSTPHPWPGMGPGWWKPERRRALAATILRDVAVLARMIQRKMPAEPTMRLVWPLTLIDGGDWKTSYFERMEPPPWDGPTLAVVRTATSVHYLRPVGKYVGDDIDPQGQFWPVPGVPCECKLVDNRLEARAKGYVGPNRSGPVKDWSDQATLPQGVVHISVVGDRAVENGDATPPPPPPPPSAEPNWLVTRRQAAAAWSAARREDAEKTRGHLTRALNALEGRLSRDGRKVKG